MSLVYGQKWVRKDNPSEVVSVGQVHNIGDVLYYFINMGEYRSKFLREDVFRKYYEQVVDTGSKVV